MNQVVEFTLSKSETENLNEGVNFINRNGSKFIVHKDGDNIKACKNICRHNGGMFVADIEDINTSIVKCSYHGWKLDCATMKYVNPPDCLDQEELVISSSSQVGDITASSVIKSLPWMNGEVPKQELGPNEFTITYLSHACIEVKLGDLTIVTDPWLTGPAFGRGWWLLHEPPSDAWEKLKSASAIYISHSHPDHCNEPTLRQLYELNPHVHIYVANLKIPVLKRGLTEIGFCNIHTVCTEVWVTLSDQARFMILPDTLYPHLDTCLLIEYKGVKVLNLVDCGYPNNGLLPTDISVLLSDFASGASGFPSCFTDQYPEDEILSKAKEKASIFLKKVVRHAAATGAKVWIPFAGYFVEAHPSDDNIRCLNYKNSPEHASSVVKRLVPTIETWLPYPGGVFDVGSMRGSIPDLQRNAYLKERWEFDKYTSVISNSMSFLPLHSLQGVEHYFDWLGFFSYSLQLHVVETTDDFQKTIREYIVNFSGSKISLHSERLQDIPYFRVRVRSSVLRHVMLTGSSWDDIYIGFSGRFYADPNIYHFKFWDHVSNKVPTTPPKWDFIDKGKNLSQRVIFCCLAVLLLSILCMMFSNIIGPSSTYSSINR